MKTIQPFLWFDDQAEAAVDLYVSLIPGSKKGAVTHYGPGMPRPAGSVMTVDFEIGGVRFAALNGGPIYQFTSAISFVVPCDSQAEIDRLWAGLGEGGKELQCGWLVDRFGVTWQIIPAELPSLLAKSPKATAAMMGMKKLDLAALQAAAKG